MLRVINEIEKATGIKPIPLQTTKAEKCIIYRFWQTAAFSHRLELRVVAFNLAEAETLAASIITAISNVGDSNKIAGVPSVVLNGGGVLADNETKTVHRLLYFDITIKE